jgi:hypothetical protein
VLNKLIEISFLFGTKWICLNVGPNFKLVGPYCTLSLFYSFRCRQNHVMILGQQQIEALITVNNEIIARIQGHTEEVIQGTTYTIIEHKDDGVPSSHCNQYQHNKRVWFCFATDNSGRSFNPGIVTPNLRPCLIFSMW